MLMRTLQVFAMMVTCFFLAGCETIGNVAQTVADKAKGSSAKSETQADSPATQQAASAATPNTTAAKPSAAPARTRPANTFESGGYEWLILSQSEAGIRLQTRGWATDQIAMDAANIHCRKNGRIAQQNGPPKLALLVFVIYNFNCVR
jgi:outer membrane murein-binding lipoprotein Lpp